MRWTERQQRMLQHMGLRLWWPAAGGPDAAAPAPSTTPGEPTLPPAAAAARPQAPAPRTQLVPAPTPAPAMSAPPAAPASAVASMDWPALREAVAGCRACGLCESRRRTVFGVGHEQAHWMIVGEAPGEQEDRQGEPFVGAAGQLLDRMLHALGLTRSSDGDPGPERQVYIANTLKCRPPGNRNPTPEEMAACDPFLRRQLALVQPRVVLAMGRFAVQSLLGSSEAIGRLRGRVHSVGAVPVVVTYHPAYLLRNPADKARAWADLCLAASVLTR